MFSSLNGLITLITMSPHGYCNVDPVNNPYESKSESVESCIQRSDDIAAHGQYDVSNIPISTENLHVVTFRATKTRELPVSCMDVERRHVSPKLNMNCLLHCKLQTQRRR